MPANKDTKITLYWLEKSRSQRIVWLLEELDLTYDLETFKRQPDLLAPPELKKIHPLGKSPVITLERPGKKKITLAESAVITEYLCEHFGGDKLIPKKFAEGDGKAEKGGEEEIGEESEEWMRYRYLMHYTEGSLMPFLVMQLVMDQVKDPPIPFFVKFLPRIVASQVEKAFLTRNIFAHFDFLENMLQTAPEGGPWFCGKNLSAADIMLSFPLIAASRRVPLGDKYPLVVKYVERIQKEEGYQRAIKKVEEIEGKFEAI
ncbi:glutathione s-transferase [Aspergillus sclerotialis]|uniref:Glutathione s-transferase n=1 Tax=Aspergillus sclerotialis TaxID=2070753 RepID=A0A3A2ZEI7_9EURO|nr:glutathione s-transferase [Aspergillus sclerotialis]